MKQHNSKNTRVSVNLHVWVPLCFDLSIRQKFVWVEPFLETAELRQHYACCIFFSGRAALFVQ